MLFEKDIFISYAHIDDESMIEDRKGWISEFHRALEIRLGQLLGSRPVIWRDPALQGNHIFDKEIVDQFSRVALMISIMSPRYTKSDWCIREVNEFYQACQQNAGFIVNNKARVFKVIKTPVTLDAQAECIRNILGYEFYGTDPHTGRIKEYSPLFSHTEKGYWEKLDDLANDIASFLEELKSLNGPAKSTKGATDAKESAKKVKNIYLSESSYDTRDARDSLKRELQDHGYNMLPFGQLPLVAPVLKDDVAAMLRDTQLSIHLIGNNYGIIPEGTEKSIVELQNEVAAAESINSKLPRLIWLPDNIDPVDERHKRFVQLLESGNLQQIAGADIVKGSIEDFKSVIHDKLKAMEHVPATPPVSPAMSGNSDEHRTRMVYLICDLQDLDSIVPLEDHLFGSGIEVVLPIFDGDETQIREDHIENLKNCSGVIIYYGYGSEVWLRTKMRDFMKISGYGRIAPLGFKCVYVASPATPAKQRFRTLEADVINGVDQVPITELNNLLSKI